MLGQLSNCIKTGDAPCYVPCEHTQLVSSLYGQQASTGGVIALLIDAFLAQQEDFLAGLCESKPAIAGLAELAGFRRCTPTLIDKGCLTVCGKLIRAFAIDACSPCVEVAADDAFYRATIQASRLPLGIHAASLQARAAAFGWSLFYTSDVIYLYVGTNNPLLASAVFNLFTPPLGVSLLIAVDC